MTHTPNSTPRETMTFTLIWTRRAVDRFVATGRQDPRHTITAYPVDLDSPWFRDDLDRKLQAPWILINATGSIVESASHGTVPA